MTESKKWLLMIAAVVALVVLVGTIGGACVEECKQAGNSESRCLRMCNP